MRASLLSHNLRFSLVSAVVAILALPGPANAAEIPDPATPGPFGVVRAEYDLPAVDAGLGVATTPVRPAGDIFYPASGAGPFPVLVFMHGNHSTCTSGPEAETGLIAGPSIFADYENGGCTTRGSACLR